MLISLDDLSLQEQRNGDLEEQSHPNWRSTRVVTIKNIVWSRFKVNEGTTKGKFVNILKEIGDYRLFDSFLPSSRKELQNKGLHATSTTNHVAQLNQMDEKHNIHDWTRWWACFLETSQDWELAPSLCMDI